MNDIHTGDCDVPLEFGAQWIHGEENNCLYALSNSLDLLDVNDVGDEWSGEYRLSDGSLIPTSTVDYVLKHVEAIKEEQYSQGDNNNKKEKKDKVKANVRSDAGSVDSLLRESFSRIMRPHTDHDLHDPLYLSAIFDWFLTYEKIDNACSDLRHLSIRSYTDYHECAPGSLINFKHGYDSLIEELMHRIPANTVMLNHRVTSINYTDSGVTVSCGDKRFTAQHVIVTVSLGVLKAEMIDFQPRLPSQLQTQIRSIGFGTINKIFVQFSQPFWPDSNYSLKLVWRPLDFEKFPDDLPDWVFDISGFDTVKGRDDMLMAWIGGSGAQKVERESDMRIGQVCRKVISIFTQRNDVPQILQVMCTKWYCNDFFRGSYSHPTTESDALQLSHQQLFQPITTSPSIGLCADDPEHPVILFAGEHTAQQFYSTTHGAFFSGNNHGDNRSWILLSN